jgi:cytochrome c biogenesis protein
MSAMREARRGVLTEAAASEKRAATETAAAAKASIPARAMDLLSSVRFGVVLLVLLVIASMTGMLIMQVNVEGFEKYYAELTPSQRLLYGSLGFFDIYHTWYFNALVLVLSLNIILSSIDHLPGAWAYVSKKKLDPSARWLRGRDPHAELRVEGESAAAVSERFESAARAMKYRTRVTERDGARFVFAERGAWNRLGAYAVHIGLLVIFLGGFMTGRFGHTGQMSLRPGQTSAEMSETVFSLGKPEQTTFDLPFAVECTDISQKLIERDGALTPMNTLDWTTEIRIKDPERGETAGVVSMNRPFDYRGHRFFQASFAPEGKAREIRLRVTPEAGGAAEEVTVRRNGAATLADGARVEFTDFYPDFMMQGARAATASPDYNNPAAALRVVKGGGQAEKAFAFGEGKAETAPMAGRAVAGYKFQLVDFEKVGDAHILSVQKDPGASVVYVGFVLLTLTLCAVFLFSHQRIWARVEPGAEAGEFRLLVGGDTNRNKLGFEDRFRRLVKKVSGEQ